MRPPAKPPRIEAAEDLSMQQLLDTYAAATSMSPQVLERANATLQVGAGHFTCQSKLWPLTREIMACNIHIYSHDLCRQAHNAFACLCYDHHSELVCQFSYWQQHVRGPTLQLAYTMHWLLIWYMQSLGAGVSTPPQHTQVQFDQVELEGFGPFHDAVTYNLANK